MLNNATKALGNQTTDFPNTDDLSLNTDGASSGFVSAPTVASDRSRSVSGAEATRTTILRLPEVMRRTGVSRSTIYSYLLEGAFPSAVKLGELAVGWRERDIEDWIASRPVVIHAYRAAK